MLKRLRIKFVVIIMTLVGTVLITVLGTSFASTWQTQHDIINDTLERTVQGSIYDIPRISFDEGYGFMGVGDEAQEAPGTKRPANMMILVVDLDSDGIVLATNNSPLSIDSQTLTDVLDRALKNDEDTCWDESVHLAWRRLQRSSGAWRVALADTYTTDISLQRLALRDICIVLIAMAVLLLIAIGLSTWVLRPVEEAWEQQRRFVADASHELKTPLAVIIANTQILERDSSISSDALRWVKSTADESSHMKSLVEELLELARTDESNAGTRGVMQKTPVDFSSMVENASLEFDAIAFERGTQIENDIAPDIMVTGDPEWLERLCKILIENACKYSAGPHPVTVTLAREGRRCVLSVNNHGNVIDEEDLPHVFDRFYRTDKARSRDANVGGFGLGLAIAKGIATAHGGDITVNSTESDGTTFRATLPLR